MCPAKIDPPKDASDIILGLAGNGFSKKGIAHKLGVCQDTFNRWLSDHPELQKAMDEGREDEHNALFNALYIAATKKNNATAAMFLLKTRHGYREGDQGDLANKVSIEFKLPGALPVSDFKVIQNEPDTVEQLPGKSTSNS